MADNQKGLGAALDRTIEDFQGFLEEERPRPSVEHVGTVTSIDRGVALVEGLSGVGYEEMVLFEGRIPGMVLDADPKGAGVIVFDESESVEAGSEVTRTGRVMETPVGENVLGRVMDPLGRPLDTGGAVQAENRLPFEREAPGIMERAPVAVPLQTGIKAIDAMIPVGRGQRELILGDRQTGKTAIAVDAIINQGAGKVICIYCAIGKRGSAVAKVINQLRERNAMDYTVIVVATAESSPGLQFAAPYAATSIGEHFMESGKDVLIVYDDLTYHARAYREIALLLRRPPGREAYPGDIFYIHSRLLERSTHMRDDLGGGSLTALPIIETEAQNISGYIPTNLISITDGQIYLSPDLFHKGILPAIDVGKSVSRVGGDSQLNAYRGVVGDLKLAYSQFEELETFARFGTRLDEETKQSLERGRRVREILKQPESTPIPVPEQVAVLVAVNAGILDDVELDRVADIEKNIREAVRNDLPDVGERILSGQDLGEDDRNAILDKAREVVQSRAG